MPVLEKGALTSTRVTDLVTMQPTNGILQQSKGFAITPAITSQDLADICKLFQAYAESLGIDLSFQDFQTELASLPGKYDATAKGALLLAKDSNGTALGCVAVRSWSGDICEMKRLYVAPDARGTGLGKELANASIAQARILGYSKMRLDTLATMATAQKMYMQIGFREIPAYRHNPIDGTKYLELDLQ